MKNIYLEYCENGTPEALALAIAHLRDRKPDHHYEGEFVNSFERKNRHKACTIWHKAFSSIVPVNTPTRIEFKPAQYA